MDYAIFARTSIMRYRSVIIFLPKILSFRQRKMVTYHNGAPTTAVRRDSWTASSTLASKGKKKKIGLRVFSAGRVIFFLQPPLSGAWSETCYSSSTFSYRGRSGKDRTLLLLRVCVSVYLYVRVLEGRRSKWFLIDDGNWNYKKNGQRSWTLRAQWILVLTIKIRVVVSLTCACVNSLSKTSKRDHICFSVGLFSSKITRCDPTSSAVSYWVS